MNGFSAKWISSSIALATMFFGFITPCSAALDSSFNSNGIVLTPIGSGDDGGRALAIQTDGKILVGGYTNAGRGTGWDFALVRYNSNGTLDNSFNTTGNVVTSMGIGDDQITGILIQADKKIVVAGNMDTTQAGNSKLGLARYDTTGALDVTFGASGNGKVLFSTGVSWVRANEAALQADGKIVVVGQNKTVISDDSNDVFVARVNTDGTPDATFGTNGWVTTAISNKKDDASSVAIQPDGKIVVAGGTKYATEDIFLARYKTNGSLDSTFGTNGIVTTAIGTGDEQTFGGLALLADGKIVISAFTDIGGGDFDWAVLRYNSTGLLDNTFGTNGITITSFGTGPDLPTSCNITGDGSIVLTGLANYGTNADFAIAQYTSTGTLDNTFGTNGKAQFRVGSSGDLPIATALDANGKLVVAGEASNGTNQDFAVIRYNLSAGSLVRHFVVKNMVRKQSLIPTRVVGLGSNSLEPAGITYNLNGQALSCTQSMRGKVLIVLKKQ